MKIEKRVKGKGRENDIVSVKNGYIAKLIEEKSDKVYWGREQ